VQEAVETQVPSLRSPSEANKAFLDIAATNNHETGIWEDSATASRFNAASTPAETRSRGVLYVVELSEQVLASFRLTFPTPFKADKFSEPFFDLIRLAQEGRLAVSEAVGFRAVVFATFEVTSIILARLGASKRIEWPSSTADQRLPLQHRDSATGSSGKDLWEKVARRVAAGEGSHLQQAGGLQIFKARAGQDSTRRSSAAFLSDSPPGRHLI